MENNNNLYEINSKTSTNYETKAFQILDVLGNTDPSYFEIEIAEKLLAEFPLIHPFLMKFRYNRVK